MIRRYVESDYGQVERIYNSSKLDELRFEQERFDLLPLEHDDKRRNRLIESEIYLRSDGVIQGFVALCGSEISGLFVCPDYRRIGVGNELLSYVLSRISGDIHLYVASSNKIAIKLYEKYRFRVSDTFITEYNSKQVLANKMTRFCG